jgi:hypothetical protein
MRGLAVAMPLLLAACATLEQAGRPSTRPSGDEGMVTYVVGGLSFEAPSGWSATGDERRVRIASPQGQVRIEADAVARPVAGEAECLADAEAVLARSAAGLTNARRHLTSLAGRRAVTQEGDQGAWHGWAYAVCDGTTQYRIWFTGLSPMGQEALEAQRVLVASAQLGAAP